MPALLTPPKKVGPVIAMAVVAPLNLLVPSIKIPWDEALMTPLSKTPPVMVLPEILMPVAAEIVLALVMPPEKVEAWKTNMPSIPAEIVPALEMPFEKTETLLIEIPSPPAEIVPVPLLTMPPEKVVMVSMKMPLPPAEICRRW